MDGGGSYCEAGGVGERASGVGVLSHWGYFCLCFKKYADFSGRARRKEYWSFVLCEVIVLSFLTANFFIIPAARTALRLVLGVWAAASLLPGLAVAVRRLHDVSLSGALAYVLFVLWKIIEVVLCVRVSASYWVEAALKECLISNQVVHELLMLTLLFAVGLLAALFTVCFVLLVFFCMNGTRGDNKYGPDPKI